MTRHEHRDARRAENMAIAVNAQNSSACKRCGAVVGETCMTKNGHELLTTCDAPGAHRERLKSARRGPEEAVQEPEYVTIADLMRVYGVSRATIYRRIKDGTLKAYRFGPRTIRFDLTEVDAAFRGTTNPGAAA